MGQWGSKHVAADVLLHYCDSDQLYAFVGLHCGDWFRKHEVENVRSISITCVVKDVCVLAGSLVQEARLSFVYVHKTNCIKLKHLALTCTSYLCVACHAEVTSVAVVLLFPWGAVICWCQYKYYVPVFSIAILVMFICLRVSNLKVYPFIVQLLLCVRTCLTFKNFTFCPRIKLTCFVGI